MRSLTSRIAVAFVLLCGGGIAAAACKSSSDDAPPATPASLPPSSSEDEDSDNDDTAAEDGVDDAASVPPAPGDPVTPIPTKIRYVIVKENHTFDNYFTGFPGAESSKTAKLSNGTTITQRPPPPSKPAFLAWSRSCGAWSS